jgi:hypothetical protein
MMLSGTGNAWGGRRPDSAVPVGGGAAPSADAPAQSDGVRAEAPLPAAGVLDELSGALAWARAALANFLELMSLEARRAGLALMWMVVGGVVAAICIVGAWLGMMAALAMWAVSLGFPPIAAVIAVAGINLVAGAVLICVCIGMGRDLLFSATRRQVAGNPPGRPPAP